MKAMNDKRQRQNWLNALNEVARQHGIDLPAFEVSGMGTARSATLHNRFVTMKRMLPGSKSSFDGVQWALWQQPADTPLLVAAFRDAIEPEEESVERTLTIIKGWLVDQWTTDDTKRAVSKHPGAQAVKTPAEFVASAQ